MKILGDTMKKYLYIISIITVLLFSACTTQEPPKQKVEFNSYPLHFLGLIPEADSQTHYQLDLISKDVYFLRTKYLKNDIGNKAKYDIGKWYVDTHNRIVLLNAKTAPRYFFIIDKQTIELMNSKGQRITSELNYKLKYSDKAKNINPRLSMIGMYSYMADAAIFEESITGMKFPVAFEDDNIALERAYLKNRRVAGQKIKVHLDAKIEDRDAVDSDKKRPYIIVKRFIKIIPQKHTKESNTKANITNTYWRLSMIGKRGVVHISNTKREAHMVLSQGFLKGNSGCNSMVGGYKLDANKLSLSKKGLRMTRMYCEGSIEKEFVGVLKNMYRYKITGEHLELFDRNNVKLAKFKSVYLY